MNLTLIAKKQLFSQETPKKLILSDSNLFQNWQDISLGIVRNPNENFLLQLKNLNIIYRPLEQFNLPKMFDFPCGIINSHLKFGSRSSNSIKSQAKYLAYHNDGLLLQYIPPNSGTSLHYHNRTVEHYFCLEGKCTLQLGTKENPLQKNIFLEKNTFTVLPGEVHRVITDNTPVINFLIMQGCPKNLKMSDHFYVEPLN